MPWKLIGKIALGIIGGGVVGGDGLSEITKGLDVGSLTPYINMIIGGILGLIAVISKGDGVVESLKQVKKSK